MAYSAHTLGDKIPWGVGKLVEKPRQHDEKTNTAGVQQEAISSSSPVSSSSAAPERTILSAPEPSVIANVNLAINKDDNENAQQRSDAAPHHFIRSSFSFWLAIIFFATFYSIF